MKLWEIKANALRLMFADTDLDFSYNDFEEKVVYSNSNTRDKLVRMDDSIRRGIDLYYQYNKSSTQTKDLQLMEHQNVYLNSIDPSGVEFFSTPLRIDAYFYKKMDEHNKHSELFEIDSNINFIYNDITGKIEFNENYTDFENKVVFKLWYSIERLNIPIDADELVYDLNDLYLPEELQRRLPYYVKGELYEEDEPSMANVAKQDYLQFIVSMRKKFSNVQKKVKTSPVFNQNNW